MLVFRASHRAARLAETLSPALRPLHTASRIASRPSNVATLQRFSLEFYSCRNAGINGPFTVRHFSSSQTDEDAREENKVKVELNATDLEGEKVYQAPMSRAVRLMKAVSVTSCTLTSIGMPVLCVLSEQDTSTVGKWAMCGTIMLFGFGTTSLFHYLFKPYVMRMWLTDSSSDVSSPSAAGDADPTVTVETVTLFAQLQKSSFRLSEVSPPTQAMHPMVSFQARDRHYFIHPEAFEDQNLLNKLVGAGKRK